MNISELKAKPRATRASASVYNWKRVGSEPEPEERQPMQTFYVDIETIPLPLEAREFMRPTSFKLGNLKDPAKIEAKKAEVILDFEAGIDAGLDELQTQIAIIGWIVDDGQYQAVTLADMTEKEMLAAFWSCVKPFSTDCQIIGHNVKGFDGPMLIHRSWINNLEPPRYLVGDLAQYAPRQWKDTMLLWQLGNRGADMRSLKHLCGAFNIPVKESEITGSTFAEWWAKDKLACIEYNHQDVRAVKMLWEKIGK